jgi:SAM-dependent methyltransferase
MALEQPTTTPTTACQPAALVRLIELIDAAVPLRGRELLDIGCGDGRFTAAVANRFDHVHAVDCDHAALGSFGASNRPENVAVELMSVLDLSFPDGTFDRVTAIDLLEELHDVPQALREIHRVLRPGGFVVLTTPNRLWPAPPRGYCIGGRKVPGWLLPGATWIPDAPRRLGGARAYTRGTLHDTIVDSGLQPYASATMFPTLHSGLPTLRSKLPTLDSGERTGWQRLASQLESSPIGLVAQTLIFVARRA